jgi:proton glutamate symport protein
MKLFARIPLSVNILIGLVMGLVVGFLMLQLQFEQFVLFWIKPWGDMFLNVLKLIAVPIVFLSIVCGIFGMGNMKDFSKLAGKTFLLYIITTTIAISIGLALVNIVQPGNVFDKTEQAQLQEQFGDIVVERQTSADEIKNKGPLRFLVDIVPENIIHSASDNSNMLQIIFIAMLLGLSILMLPEGKTTIVRQFFTQFNGVFVFLVELIMKTAPVGVFSLMCSMMVEFGGSSNLLKALGLYTLTVISGLLFVTFILYPLVLRVFSGLPMSKFLKGIFPAQIVAFTTSSSAITLPVTKRQVEKELQVPEKVSGFVLPLGMTINMDGTSLYQVVAVLFISQVFGIDLSFSQQMFIILLAVLSSIGAPGIPGGSIVMLIFILTSVGIPAHGLALILGVDRPLDMLRTTTNVTGDSMICYLLRNSFKEKQIKQE